MVLEETAVQKALATNTVLRQIFRCLSVSDLLKFSALNKTWNYEARCVLRNERRCVASVKGRESWKKAKLLNEQMGQMNIMFYNGLAIKPYNYRCAMYQKMEEVLGNIMKMPLKYLEINWKGGNCILLQLASAFLKRSLSLEYLHIVKVPLYEKFWTAQENNGRGEEQEPFLPKLKILEISDDNEEDLKNLFQTNFLAEMTSRAANLEELKLASDVRKYYVLPPEYMKFVKSNFGITTASVALATFFTHGVQSISPGMLNQMLQLGQFYTEKLGIRPPTHHSTAIQLINEYGSIESDELWISAKLFFVEKPTFKGELDNYSSVVRAFDKFCEMEFSFGIVNVDWMYICFELAKQADGDHWYHIFDPVGYGSFRENGNVKKATIVRCPRLALSGYLANVFTGAPIKDFTITPVVISKIIQPRPMHYYR